MLWINMCIAAVLQLVGLLFTGRLIWPQWKIPGKVLFYLGFSFLFSYYWPYFGLAFIFIHPALGIAGHIWFCKQIGMTWWKVEDPEKYIQAQKDWVQQNKNQQ